MQLTSSPSAASALEISITEATRIRNAQYAARGGNGNTLVMSAPPPPPPSEPKQRLISIVLPTTPSDGASACSAPSLSHLRHAQAPSVSQEP